MQLFTGTVQSIGGAKAVVVPDEHPEIVTREYIVPYYWRHEMGNIQPGCDGEWDYTIRNTLIVEQAVTFQDTLSVSSDAAFSASVTVSGSMSASGTITGGSVTLQTHTHTSTVAGTPTSAPIA